MNGFNFVWISLFLIGSQLSWPVNCKYDQYTRGRCLINRYSKWRPRDMPQYGTMNGIHDYDFLLNDMSVEGYEKRFERAKHFLKTLNNIEKTETDPAEIINLKVLRYELETFINFYPFKGFYLALNQMQGPQNFIELVLGKMPRKTLQDYETLLKRMKKISKQIDQVIDLLKTGVIFNTKLHNISVTGTVATLKSKVNDDPTISPFYAFFSKDFPASFTPEQINLLQTTAKTIITKKINPAFTKLADYLEKEYVPRTDIAISSINNGQAFYSAIIKFHTGTNLTAQQVHDIGLKEVEKLKTEMTKIKDEMGHSSKTLKEFNEIIKADPNNLFSTPEEMVARVNYIIDELITPNLTKIITKIPKAKIIVEVINEEYAPLAYYTPGTLDGTKSGTFTINTGNLKATPKYMLISLTMHEALPGHHFQISHAIESEDYPLYRKASDTSNYGHAPSLFPIYTEFVEGWGLYAETLGFDLNLYDNLLDRYGHYNENMLRACRLVVDTGIHALGWTQEAAVQYYLDNLAITKNRAEGEIIRYITIPGQALSYKMGQIKIEQIRDEAKQTLGNLFNLKEFNDIVLDSFGPLTLAEEQVKKWVAEKLSI